MVSHSKTRVKLLSVLALVLMICSVARGADEEGVVVLRSGGVLHGKISVSGERYLVTGPKSVVDVAAPQVVLVASSMDDAYAKQCQQLPPDSAEAHLKLAEWCLRYNLVKPAEQELATARRLDARDPRLGLLERRLAVANQPKKSHAPATAAATHEDAAALDEARELKAMAKALPPAAVERFARKVQPLLVNSCTASGCHRPNGKQDFQLDRAVLHGVSNRRITLRNLAAVLELIDRSSPQQSDLLTLPRRPHGGMTRPILGPRQESQLVQLVDWVGLVTATNVMTEPVEMLTDFGAGSFGSGLSGAGPSESVAPISSVKRGRQPRRIDSNVIPASHDEMESLLPKSEVQFGANLKPWQPKDAFDPELFNRQTPNAAAVDGTTAVGPPATR